VDSAERALLEVGSDSLDRFNVAVISNIFLDRPPCRGVNFSS
jgi:hypothetical protein